MPVLATEDWKVTKNTDETSPTFGTFTFTFWLRQKNPKIMTGRIYNRDLDPDRLDGYAKKKALYDEDRSAYYEKLYEHTISTKKIIRNKTINGWHVNLDGTVYCFSYPRISSKDPPKQQEKFMTNDELHTLFETVD